MFIGSQKIDRSFYARNWKDLETLGKKSERRNALNNSDEFWKMISEIVICPKTFPVIGVAMYYGVGVKERKTAIKELDRKISNYIERGQKLKSDMQTLGLLENDRSVKSNYMPLA